MDFQLEPDNEDRRLQDRAREIFLPARPITMQTSLRGRTRQLERTLEALQTPGQSVFIFGERGVGKTSLAQTAAFLCHTAECNPIFIACHRKTTFSSLVAQMVRHITGQLGVRAMTTQAKVGVAGVFEILRTIQERPLEEIAQIDPSLVVDLLNAACPGRLSGKVIVLIDEVDVVSDETRGDLAYLIKQLGDRECRVKVILAGIGESIESLLREHESASRYMATIKLDRLTFSDLREIIAPGFADLSISVPDNFVWRVVQISDGFAHFTHLLGLKIAVRAIERGAPRKVDSELFGIAIKEAVEDSEGWLKQKYDLAVQKYRDVYEPALWAAADHWELQRSTDQIYQSYLRICKDLGRNPEAKRPAFYNRLYSLRQAAHGHVLRSPRKSWYQFSDSMVRGYCRLVGEAQGIQVGKDYGQ